jgi:hypothetical protein
MGQRDLIKDEIEQLGKVLGKILSDFLKLKTKGQVSLEIQASIEQLKTKVDIDLEELVKLSIEELESYLEQKKITWENFGMLSDYLIEIGESELSINKNSAKMYLTKASELIDLFDKHSKILSFERMNKKSKIENALLQCV